MCGREIPALLIRTKVLMVKRGVCYGDRALVSSLALSLPLAGSNPSLSVLSTHSVALECHPEAAARKRLSCLQADQLTELARNHSAH